MFIKKYLCVALFFIGVNYNSNCEKIKVLQIPLYLAFGGGLVIHENINLQNDYLETYPYNDIDKYGVEKKIGLLYEFNIFSDPKINYDIGIMGLYCRTNFDVDAWGNSIIALIPDAKTPNIYKEGYAGTMYNVNVIMIFFELTSIFRMRFNTTYPSGLVIGPCFNFPLSTNMEETLKLVIPSNSVFSDSIKYRLNSSKNVAYLYNGKIKNINNVLYGLTIGTFLGKNISSNFCIMIELTYTHPINEIIDNGEWYINKFNLGVGLKYKLSYDYFP